MAIQVEDFVDCLKFLNHHSQGYSKKPVGSLQASHVNLQSGRAQPKMQETNITEGCLGIFGPTLCVGNI